jgi:hypothetical protein
MPVTSWRDIKAARDFERKYGDGGMAWHLLSMSSAASSRIVIDVPLDVYRNDPAAVERMATTGNTIRVMDGDSVYATISVD